MRLTSGKLAHQFSLKGEKNSDGWPTKVTGWRLEPKTPEHVAALLHQASANGQTLAMNEQDTMELHHLGKEPVWLDVTNLDKVRWHRPGDLTVMVESGITMRALSKFLEPHGQCWPLTYPTDMRLINILASDTPSLEASLLGYPKDWVLGLEIAHPDGSTSKCGAQVVKNATGYDLNKLYIGSEHQFGVITAATLKLQIKPESSSGWWISCQDLNTALSTLQALSNNSPISFQQSVIVSDKRVKNFQWPKHNAKDRPIKSNWNLFLGASGSSPILEELAQSLNNLNSEALSDILPRPRNKPLPRGPLNALAQ